MLFSSYANTTSADTLYQTLGNISFICLFAAILMMKMEILKGDKEKTEDKAKKIQKQSMEEENKVQ